MRAHRPGLATHLAAGATRTAPCLFVRAALTGPLTVALTALVPDDRHATAAMVGKPGMGTPGRWDREAPPLPGELDVRRERAPFLLHASCLFPKPAWPALLPSLAARLRCPSCWCAPRTPCVPGVSARPVATAPAASAAEGQTLTQEPCGSTVHSLGTREKDTEVPALGGAQDCAESRHERWLERPSRSLEERERSAEPPRGG